ncbi:TetR family transcriptional regulator [Mycobacterium sp. 3519A]|uniref:TetR family transcriptional regulator n=1 Tax=Mycobacterium sp. 3519A TaxID=2057184 RepID=UPI000C7A178C|nr:TetR family transcriptional regulator [Mycobacterium sp. 3519A]
MSRWQPNARGRLEQAALELYAERGFDETTVAEIAERAGLTERTFFRHFTDKREVLFGGQDALVELINAAIAQAPESASPIDAAGDALRAAGAMLEDRREQARRRQAVIDANPGLQERELIKLASLAEAIAAALRRRGLAESAAALTAETAIAVFKVAYNKWLTAGKRRDLPRLVGDSLDELKALTGQAPRA